MRVALFHPWIHTKGGAERLILEWLKRTEFDVNVYTWAYHPEGTFKEFEKFDIEQVLPDWLFDKKQSAIRGLALRLIGMWKRFLNGEDVLMISTAGIAELVLNSNRAKWNIAYVHTPLRSACQDDLPWIRKHIRPLTKKPISWVKRAYFETITAGYNVLEKMMWDRMDGIMLNSETTLKRAKKKDLIKGQRVGVVWPGVELPEKIIDRSDGSGRVLYLSRISEFKRQLEVIRAWELAEKHLPESAKLVIAGAPSTERYLKRVLREAKGHSVEIKTDLTDEEVNEEYAKADACIFAGWNEDFGIAPLEAMAWGKPLIAVDGGGFWEVINRARARGVIAVEDSIDSSAFTGKLASGIKTFFQDTDTWKKLGVENAKAIRSIDLSWDRMAREIDTFIKEVVK